MIGIESVSHRVAGQQVLADISLRIETGGVVALVGPNGAGKSTLLSLIARLQPLQQGRITVEGLEVGRAPDDDLARVLAILPQDLNVASRLTVRDLIGFGRYPYHKGRPSEADRAFVERAVVAFDLGDLAERPLDTLSGGQRQRAFVAMTYVQDTAYLLLDEPLNNLDIAASRALMARLRGLADNQARTIIVVLHDINYAAAYADRIIAMKGGRVAADGPPDTIVHTGLLRDVFDTDAKIGRLAGRPVVLV